MQNNHKKTTYRLLNINSKKNRILYNIIKYIISFCCLYVASRLSLANGLKPIYFLCFTPLILFNLLWYLIANVHKIKTSKDSKG